jgi:hypothetical protein
MAMFRNILDDPQRALLGIPLPQWELSSQPAAEL